MPAANTTTPFQIHLITLTDEGLVTETRVGGDHGTMTAAMKAAKKVAGRGSRFVKRGVDCSYVGPNGTAAIT